MPETTWSQIEDAINEYKNNKQNGLNPNFDSCFPFLSPISARSRLARSNLDGTFIILVMLPEKAQEVNYVY